MSESEAEPDYRISRMLESVDREIRRHRGEESMGGDVPRGAHAEDRLYFQEPMPDASEPAEEARHRAKTPWSTHAKLLLGDGVTLPAPESFRSGKEVEEKLWEVINALAVRRVFIRNTNHLTNRELYAALWCVYLNEAAQDLSGCPGSACHIDLLEGAAEGERAWYRRFYTGPGLSDLWRWGRGQENGRDPGAGAYDRDRYLPKQGR